MNIGDTFECDLGVGRHLYIIISNPNSGKFFIVTMMSSYTDPVVDGWKDNSCLLFPSDGHPSIKKCSCIAYNKITEMTIDEYKCRLDNGEIKQRERLSEDVIQRILQGALKSERILNKYVDFLKSQGLLFN